MNVIFLTELEKTWGRTLESSKFIMSYVKFSWEEVAWESYSTEFS